MRALAAGLDLRKALRATARHGSARIAGALDEEFRRCLRNEIAGGPLEHYEEEFGRVRQEIDGFDLAVPMEGFPLTAQLCAELRDLVRAHGRGVRGLATWEPNEAGVVRYRPGSIGITPHLDGRWYRRLVVVVTVHGSARFAVCGSRDTDDVVDEWIAGPGDVTLMRGPGLAGARDGRPFHLVEGPKRGERLVVGVRMSVGPPS